MRNKAFTLVICLAASGAVPAAAENIRFQSPSGNITCGLTEFAAFCTIEEYTPSFTQSPRACGGDWGSQFFVLSSGDGALGCVNMNTTAPAIVLPYGTSTSLSNIRCSSETTGITCTNRDGGGFSIRRARQRIF
ncbi:hypothetical protein MWU60_03810 [Yoonia sp. F2084L]|uniref:DUF6636 domain-containing protein n=1 Tax=Yoonia sp. F2084L TaxID=2926419 RepID=UPI001FF4B963|nr:DUF6636 domain-containing protein [Yoonia sp. F2084L]MCK0094683.1 hypothetical protein [Yoonia sp. F2084L]